MTEREKIVKLAAKMILDNSHLRYGQAIFNAACEVSENTNTIANELRGTDKDCFYINSRVEKFLSHFDDSKQLEGL